MCYKETGKAPIGTRWVDINKGDEENTEYRSRFVAQEIKKDSREDLFAATPPLEANKILCSLFCSMDVTFQVHIHQNLICLCTKYIILHSFFEI